MAEYVCRDCSGRSGRTVSFKVWEGGVEYVSDSICCPVCGYYSTVMTNEEWVTYKYD